MVALLLLTSAILLPFALAFQECSSLKAKRCPKTVGCTSVPLFHQQQERMVIVSNGVDDGISAACGARLALAAHHALSQSPFEYVEPCLTLLTGQEPTNEMNDLGHLVKLVTATNGFPTTDDFEDAIRLSCENSAKTAMHVFLDRPNLALLSPKVQSSLSFLGVTPMAEDHSAATAAKVGAAVQSILDTVDANASISWDWNLHLASLKANSLPKSSAHEDTFFILPCTDAVDSALVEYHYDHSKLGGTDPLLCETNEISFPGLTKTSILPPTFLSTRASAAAYTILRSIGSSAPVSACIAYSVGAQLARENHTVPPSQDILAGIVALAKKCQENYITVPFVRKRYIDFGYR